MASSKRDITLTTHQKKEACVSGIVVQDSKDWWVRVNLKIPGYLKLHLFNALNPYQCNLERVHLHTSTA